MAVPLPRQMECPNCSHEAHSPFVCGHWLAPDAYCPCHAVPIPGVHPDIEP